MTRFNSISALAVISGFVLSGLGTTALAQSDRRPPPRMPACEDNATATVCRDRNGEVVRRARPLSDNQTRPATAPQGGPETGVVCSSETPAVQNARREESSTNGRINRNRTRPTRNDNSSDRDRPTRPAPQDSFGGDEPTWVDCPSDRIEALSGSDPGWGVRRPGDDEFGGEDPGWGEDEFGGEDPGWVRDPDDEDDEDEG